MTRRTAGTAATLLMLALAGACSSAGPSYLERLGGALRATVAPAEPEPPRERTRAELNEIPYATIGVTFAGGGRAFVVGRTVNGEIVDYRDASNRSVRLRGGALAGTEGLGVDLAAVRFAPEDPIAHPTALTDWPESVFREYRIHARSAPPYGITLACAYQRVAAETIEIVEILFDVVRVSEVCTNQARQVINTYWVEAETGFIWRSKQWVGPQIGHVTIDIIRPYAPPEAAG